MARAEKRAPGLTPQQWDQMTRFRLMGPMSAIDAALVTCPEPWVRGAAQDDADCIQMHGVGLLPGDNGAEFLVCFIGVRREKPARRFALLGLYFRPSGALACRCWTGRLEPPAGRMVLNPEFEFSDDSSRPADGPARANPEPAHSS